MERRRAAAGCDSSRRLAFVVGGRDFRVLPLTIEDSVERFWRPVNAAPCPELTHSLSLLTATVTTLCRFQILRKRAAACLSAVTASLRWCWQM
ncbi:hypothetical protein NDU88_001589 [Pleurodeles waltl]|uniref:Uncharacterized protein n=1 Tax=Pleurodeles waltl TaxID=8319 RepID=A0AAV7Q6F8_PLEWA|nr:hypothetical protein NDU88_001589 [Pleurodeles waltl]